MGKLALLAALILSGVAFGETETRVSLDDENTVVEFTTLARPGSVKLRGRADGKMKAVNGVMTVAGDKISGDVTYLLKALTTGIGLRDKHMHGFLQSEKYPEAVLKMQNVELSIGSKSAFRGKLTFHDVTKVVSGDVESRRNGDELEMVYQFKILLGDFNIERPSFMTVTLDDEVFLSAAVKLRLPSKS